MNYLTANGRPLSAEGSRLLITELAVTPPVVPREPITLVNIVPAGWAHDEFSYSLQGAAVLVNPEFTQGSGTVTYKVNAGAWVNLEEANAQIATVTDGAPTVSYTLIVAVQSVDASACVFKVTLK